MRISDWSSDVCSSDLYAGNNVWNRVSCKLKGRRIQNAPAMWVRADGAFEPLVAPELFIAAQDRIARSEEHTSELQSLMRISYAVFCLKKKKNKKTTNTD